MASTFGQDKPQSPNPSVVQLCQSKTSGHLSQKTIY